MLRNTILLLAIIFPLLAQDLLPSSPDSVHVYLRRGIQCAGEGDRERAVEAFESALRCDPSCAEAHMKLAELFMEEGTVKDRIKAERHIRRAIKLDSTNPDYHVTYGLLKLRQGFVHGAEAEFEKALEFNQNCAEAFYNLGLVCVREVWHYQDMIDGLIRFQHFAEKDKKRAIGYFQKALKIDPNYRDALFHLGLAYCESGEYEEMAGLYQKILDQHPDDTDARLFLGLAYYRQDREAEAWDEYQIAIQSMDEDEKTIFESIEPLLSPGKEKQYITASLAKKEDLERQFWLELDPLYLTDYNERLLEHYSRVAYANLRYGLPGKGIEGWQTDQGKVYIRYGPPLSCRRTRPSIEVGVEDPVRTSVEVWRYEDFDHVFEDMFLTGHYRFKWGRQPETDGLSLYTSLIQDVPQVFEYDYDGEQFEVPCLLSNFRGDEGRTTVDICYALPAQYLDYTVEGDESQVFTEVGVFFFDSHWNNVLREVADDELVTERIDPTKDCDVIARRTVQVEPEVYHFSLEIRDKVSNNIGLLRDTVTITGYSLENLQVSDILFASDIQPSSGEGMFCKGNFHIIPNPRKIYSRFESMYIYYEIYNLEQDEYGRTRYEIEYIIGPEVEERGGLSKLIGKIGGLFGARRRKGLISATSENRGWSPTEFQYLEIDIQDIPPEPTTIVLIVRDLNSKQEAGKEDRFVIRE